MVAVSVGLSISSANAACNTPVGVAGDVIYNKSQGVLQYCNNTNWIAAGAQTPQITQGYFVLASGTYTGNLSGLAGADTICLNDLNTNDWMGKSSAGPLTAGRVKAFLCDGTTCNNLAPSTQYYFARSNVPTTGGDSFTTDATGRGPGDTNSWSGATRLGIIANLWMNRHENGTASYWENEPETYGNHCTGWTVSSGVNGEYGSTSQSDNRRWSSSSQSCATANRLVCVVQPTSAGTCSSPTGSTMDILFNSASSVMQYCNGVSWIAMGPIGGVPAGTGCDTTPVTVTTPGASTFNMPANCNSVTVEAFGAGGSGSLDSQSQRGAGGGGGSSAVVRNTGSVLLVVGGGGGGGGGVDGASGSRGGGGGYAIATSAVTPGEVLDVYVGGGGVRATSDTGGAGGATGTYAGGKGGNRRQNGTGATYGGAGGGGAENTGGSSTYGGAGGAGDDGGSCGTSTNGGACSGVYGGGGGGFSISGGTVIIGSRGNVSSGAAANGGPGSGAQNATGGNGRVVITPAAGVPGMGCLSPVGVAGDLMYNTASNVLQYCEGRAWVAVGKKEVPDPCSGSPAIGTICSDGSIYASTSPDGNVPMYFMAQDAPGGAAYTWGPNGDTAMQNCSSGQTSCTTGEANTALLAGLGATYQLATYCQNLAPPDALALGHDDWYLPSQLEIMMPGMTFGTSAPYGFSAAVYMTSSEYDGTQANGFNFGTGFMTISPKTTAYRLRCVRT